MNMNNLITVAGEIISEPEIENLLDGKEYLKFYLEIKRKSGISDFVPCLVKKDKAENIKIGNKIKGIGTIKSQTIIKHMVTRVFIETLTEYEGTDYNNVLINGFICVKNSPRETALSRRIISDIILASNRSNENESDYIPTILWSNTALNIDKCGIGSELLLHGKFQSREYQKIHEDGTTEIRTAYEVSASNVDIIAKK